MKPKSVADHSDVQTLPSVSSSETLDQQIAEYLARRPEGLPMPAALKEIQASFAIEGMEISEERLAACAKRFLGRAMNGEADVIIAEAKLKFP